MNFCAFENAVPMSTLIGMKMIRVEVNKDRDEITFFSECGRVFKMFHDQSCCERVDIESITGDLSDLIGEPIIVAEESTSDGVVPTAEDEYSTETFTWTFYKLATRKGYVDIRWYGTSNGFYSESVSLVEGVEDGR